MRKEILLSLPLIVFLVLAYVLYDNLGKDSEYLESELIGKPIPEFNVPLLNAQSKDPDNFIGTTINQAFIQGPALINFWATWCPSCYQEHEALLELKTLGVRIYGVDYRDDAEKAVDFLNKLGNPFEAVLFDEQADIGFDFGVTGAPETFLIDANGIVRYRHVGVVTQQLWRETLSDIYYGDK